jgi:hypothetical protein
LGKRGAGVCNWDIPVVAPQHRLRQSRVDVITAASV